MILASARKHGITDDDMLHAYLVVVRRLTLQLGSRRPAVATDGADVQRAELVERETPVRPGVITCSMRSSLASRSGSLDSFHDFVRWNVT